MDHKEEQQMEIETLLSIYPDELTILTAENFDPAADDHDLAVLSTDDRIQFILKISSSAAKSEEAENSALATTWKFIFPPDYPDVIPEIRLLDASELPKQSTEALISLAENTATENVGMASIFTIVSAIQDYLNEHAEECLRQIVEFSERAKREEDEADREKMDGTRVSVESFIAWKIKFDAERALKNKVQIAALAAAHKRPTGRQMFQENANLDQSDLQMMEEGDLAADEELDQREEITEEFDQDLFEQKLLNEIESGDG